MSQNILQIFTLTRLVHVG